MTARTSDAIEVAEEFTPFWVLVDGERDPGPINPCPMPGDCFRMNGPLPGWRNALLRFFGRGGWGPMEWRVVSVSDSYIGYEAA